MPRFRNAIQSLTDPGERSDTNPDEWLQRRFLIVTAVAMSFGGLLWGTMALVLGLRWQATIPYGYTVITVLNLIQSSRTNSFAAARAVQVLISLLLPFALQWSLGGFVPSGAMMIWALLALTASQSFGDTRISASRFVSPFRVPGPQPDDSCHALPSATARRRHQRIAGGGTGSTR